MLRITTSAAEDGTVVRIAGRLSASGLTEFERVCGDAEQPLFLDLSELSGADEHGLSAIRRLVAQGAELVHVPPYIALLLEG